MENNLLKTDNIRLLFFGDTNFRDREILDISESKKILKEVSTYIDNADLRIMNLETPLANINECQPLQKSGPNIICDPENIVFLKESKVDIAVLANNHIGDYGEKGIRDTISTLEKEKIAYIGAGENTKQAYKASRVEIKGLKISIIALCENEPGTSTNNRWGSAGFEPYLAFHKIAEEKECSDCVIVVFHGGNEQNPLPSPETVKRYRLLCDMGADAVIAMHTHCPQGYEIYNGKPIAYSMGNFLFKSMSNCMADSDPWYYGYMCGLEITKDKQLEMDIVPYKFNNDATRINVFTGQEKVKMLDYIKKISAIINDEEELHLMFMGWCYLNQWFPIVPEDISIPYELYRSKNLLWCEAHAEKIRENYRILVENEIDKAEEYSKRIQLLQQMPF